MQNYLVRDINLAPEGRLKIDWVRAHMPVLNAIREEFVREQPFKGLKIAVSIHLEAKTAYLAEVLAAGGADVSISGSNPLSTQDDVAAALAKAGIKVYSWYRATDEEYKDHLLRVLDNKPDLVIDDGGDLIHLLHTERRHLIANIKGGCEETTTGVLRLRSLEREGKLGFPMIAVNDAYCKYLFDNRYGTGESVWSGIMRTTNLITAGKTAVVMGYGWCGKGIAMRAKGLGAKVIVTEIDPVKAIEAHMDGFTVMNSLEAAKHGHIFITATGCKDVLQGEHYEVMQDGAIMCNAGHFDVEVNKPQLKERAVKVRTVRKDIEEYEMADGRRLYLLAEGRLVNLAAGDGHPAEIMDMSFALQALSAKYVLEQAGSLENRVYDVPAEIDARVANIKLESMGIKIDKLTPEQAKYINAWNHAQ
ncbi:adenosylhomocysteinase [Desulfofalx alkaliphila]|uniref:adenosylhomocysteinase n=1 Tax=Desulfofalx alkaliphila TaxID=105483 RepID=UPI0004E133AD|nr:adenosylhomocysteinase [Desulfofalx alkaliphila]